MTITLGRRAEALRNKVLIAAVLLVSWQIASTFYQPWIVPGLYDIAIATYAVMVDPVFNTYTFQVWATFRRLLIGFLISLVVGGIVGTAMGLRTEVESFFRSWVVLGLAIPSIAVAFALVIILGINDWVPILTIVIIGTPFVMLNMWEGAQALDQEIVEMGVFFGAGRYQRFRHILVPQLLPYLFPSMYWGFVVCWKVLFIAEVFGAGSGIGYMVNYWYLQQRVDLLLGWVLVPVIVVILAQESLRYAEDRIMVWR